MRFLIHWALRRDELCDPKLCHDAPDEGGRCDHCPLDRLDAAQATEAGHLLRRAIYLRGALKMGFRIALHEVRADELSTMMIFEEMRDRLDREQASREIP